jgi:hypothetical protein
LPGLRRYLTLARPVARRHTHQHPEQDPLSLAVAAVAHWLADQQLELQWFIGGQIAAPR